MSVRVMLQANDQRRPTNDRSQITTVSLYSPYTFLIASEVSPTVALASTAARILGIRFSPERAGPATAPPVCAPALRQSAVGARPSHHPFGTGSRPRRSPHAGPPPADTRMPPSESLAGHIRARL